MANSTTALSATFEAEATSVRAPESEWRRVWSRLARNPMAIGGAVVVLVWVAIAASAPWIAPYDPIDQDIVDRLP
ncbi:MAG TPA: ABC transporter permease, partial [Candidatus Methylomirabilis sp.]|nr:ABC transporter permease [Candidatus Methylomirabilis sp.]